jgi:hypothetical protein
MTSLDALIVVAKAALAQNEHTPEADRLSCRTLLEAALPYLEEITTEVTA